MKKILLFMLFMLAAGSCSQPGSIKPSVLGGKKYDSARAVIITKNGFTLAGMTQSLGLGSVDVYLMQTGKNGRLKKQNTYGGKDDDRGFAMAYTPGKGYMIAGYTASYGAGKTDAYLVKTKENGDYISAKVFGGPQYDEIKGITADGTGGFILAGHSNSFSSGDYDAYILRVDADGNCVWAKTFGGKGNETINAVIPHGKDNFMAVGSSNSKSGKLQDMYSLVFDINGKPVNEFFYPAEYSGEMISAAAAGDGNYVIAGEKGTKDTVTDIVLMKASPDGKVIWEKTFGGERSDYPAQVIKTKDGGFAVAATTESQGSGMSDALILKTDKDGNLLWERVFGGREDDYAGGIAEDSDGGLVLAGWTRSYGTGDYDIYLVKTDKNGNVAR